MSVGRTVARNTVVLVAERTACIEETVAVAASVERIDVLAERTACIVGTEVAAGTDIRGIEGIHVVFREQERCM